MKPRESHPGPSPTGPSANRATGFFKQLDESGGLAALLLMAVTFLAYWPCLRGQFVWDDDSWTTSLAPYFKNSAGLLALWIHPTVLQQYIPLTGTTFWLDYQLWGFSTWPGIASEHHSAWHRRRAVLARLARWWGIPGAWLAGAILALHPVMVESAAWITERKNVLSVCLFLIALFAYGKFTRFWKEPEGDDLSGGRTPGQSFKNGRRRGDESQTISVKEGKVRDSSPRLPWEDGSSMGTYAAALLLFFAALLAKATTFSFPPLLLLLAWWKRGRLRWRADILPTVPFFTLAIGFGLFNSWIEKHQLGAQGSRWSFTLAERCLIAGRALWFYAGKLLWPANLCFVYPRWHIDSASPAQWLFPLAAVAALLALWLGRNRIGRGPAAAVLFFVGSLLPLLGFMNIYFMRYSFVCDHWVYLPSLGFIALAAALVARAAEKLRAPALQIIFAVIVLPVFATMTWRDSAEYANAEQLYSTTLARNPNATMAHINLAQFLIAVGRFDEAIGHLQTAIVLEPDEPIAHRKLGVALAQKGLTDDAIAEFQKAIALKPDFAGAYFSLGDAFYHQHRLTAAAAQFQKAVQFDTNYALAFNNLAAISLEQGRAAEAIAYDERAVAAVPDDPDAQSRLGLLLLDQGRLNDALPHLAKAAELRPEDAVLCNNFAHALLLSGQTDAALNLFRQALELQPNYRDAHYNLGDALSRKGLLDEAVVQFQQVVNMDPRSAEAHRSLGVVLFRQRRPADALTQLQQAVQLEPENVDACNSLAWFLATCPDSAFRNGPKASSSLPKPPTASPAARTRQCSRPWPPLTQHRAARWMPPMPPNAPWI